MTGSTDILTAALARCRAGLVAALAFSLVINLLMLTSSVYMMQLFDRVLSSGRLETLVYLTLVALGAVAVLSVLEVSRAYLLGRLGAWLDGRLAPEAVARVLGGAACDDDYKADSLRDLGALRAFIGSPALVALLDAPWVPIYLGVVYLFDPLLGHVALGGALILLLLAVVGDRVTRRRLGEATAAARRSQHTMERAVRNVEVIDAMGMLPGVLDRWGRSHGESVHGQLLVGDRSAVLLALSRFARQAIQILALAVGSWLVIRSDLPPGAMVAGSILMGRALAPVEQAIGTWRQAVQARQAHRRLLAFFRKPKARFDMMPLPAPRGDLEVRNLSFAVPGRAPILTNVSFSLAAGEAMAIIGPSASGKSTLARLLVGVSRPSAGAVRIDGGDVHTWPRESLGPHLGYLPQDVELFGGTIRENISRLRNADPDRVVEAAVRANCHDMILRMERGYETEIGDGGALLSGGQRQRIALARALFGPPRLVVLDEPNANLDGEGEEALARAIREMKALGAAVVLIVHRSNLLSQVDRLLVLSGGRVDLHGPTGEVLETLRTRSSKGANVPSPVRSGAPPQEVG